jgi:hypothetical protein
MQNIKHPVCHIHLLNSRLVSSIFNNSTSQFLLKTRLVMFIFKCSACHAHLLNTRLDIPIFKHSAGHVHLLNTQLGMSIF